MFLTVFLRSEEWLLMEWAGVKAGGLLSKTERIQYTNAAVLYSGRELEMVSEACDWAVENSSTAGLGSLLPKFLTQVRFNLETLI